jgi:N-acetyl sugar amidotransferase
MRIAFICDINDLHNIKWISFLSNKHNVIIITNRKKENNNLNLFLGIDNVKVYHILPTLYTYRSFILKQNTIKEIKKVLLDERIDVLHSIYVVPFSIWAHHTKFQNHIVTTYGSDMLIDYNVKQSFFKLPVQAIISFLLRREIKKALNKAKFITSTSNNQQQVIREFIKDEDKLSIIRTGVNCEEFLKVYNQLEKQNKEITIFSCRAMQSLYNIHLIVDGFVLLKQKEKSLSLKLVLINYCADNDYFNSILKKIEDNNINEHVIIKPNLSTQQLIQEYKNSDVVVMVPKSDGSPVTGMETLLAQKPLIMGNVSYDKDLYSEDTVWKLETITAESICNKIIEIIKLPKEVVDIKTSNGFRAVMQKGNLQLEIDKLEVLYKKMSNQNLGNNYLNQSQSYNQCSRCVMDNLNDPNIYFDEHNFCNYCNDYYTQIKREESTGEYNIEKLMSVIQQIKEDNKDKKYDCIVGVSGGIDSAFLVYKLVEFGLRPLAVHYDNGWNSEVATQNIQMLLNKLNVDLYTYVNDWEEFKDIQLSFFKAGVVDIELITDHAILAVFNKAAEKHQINYVFSGYNDATESILPPDWYHWKLDGLNIKAIHRRFGKVKLKTFPTLNYLTLYKQWKLNKIKKIDLLNYINYNKEQAQEILIEKVGWRSYGSKHSESIFTRFYQNYILPVKFNIDKRKAHLSSLICSNQITREEALLELQNNPWEANQTLLDKEYVLKKLGVTETTFDGWMKQTPVSHFSFPSYLTRHDKILKKLKSLFS